MSQMIHKKHSPQYYIHCLTTIHCRLLPLKPHHFRVTLYDKYPRIWCASKKAKAIQNERLQMFETKMQKK